MNDNIAAAVSIFVGLVAGLAVVRYIKPTAAITKALRKKACGGCDHNNAVWRNPADRMVLCDDCHTQLPTAAAQPFEKI